MALLLWVGGLLGFLAQMPQLGIAIWLVNLINGAFSFWQEYKAEQATAALRQLLPTYARVVRDGQEQRLLAEELVPGDVMLLAEGDHISADGRLVHEAALRVDQSTLTGEAHPVRKTAEAVLRGGLTRVELPNLVFAGTSVAAGTGRAVVCATGMATEFGKVAHLTQVVGDERSPLQHEMVHTTQGRDPDCRRGGPAVFCAGGHTGRCDAGGEWHFCHRDDCGLCARRAAPHRDPRTRDGDPTHRPPPCPHQTPVCRRNPGVYHGHLHGQDRDTHPKRDDRV